MKQEACGSEGVDTGRLLTIAEVADGLRVCGATAYRLVADGSIPAVRISSGAIRVPATAVSALVDDGAAPEP